jgi:hypothetical protein
VGFEITREGEAGATGWVPSQATLFRRSVLDQLPFAVELDLECQNADWCLRVEEFAPGTLRRCPDARVVGAPAPSGVRGTNLVSRANAVRSLPSHARFLEIHGRLLAEPLLELIPELRDPDGSVNVHAATILLGLVTAHGTNWTLMEWMNGGLDILLAGRPTGEEPEFSEEKLERVAWLEERNEILIGIENGGWWQLRNRLRKVVGK